MPKRRIEEFNWPNNADCKNDSVQTGTFEKSVEKNVENSVENSAENSFVFRNTLGTESATLEDSREELGKNFEKL